MFNFALHEVLERNNPFQCNSLEMIHPASLSLRPDSLLPSEFSFNHFEWASFFSPLRFYQLQCLVITTFRYAQTVFWGKGKAWENNIYCRHICVLSLLILKIKILPEIQEFLCCLVIKSAYNLMCPFQEVCSRFAQILFIRSHSSILPASHKKMFSSDLMTNDLPPGSNCWQLPFEASGQTTWRDVHESPSKFGPQFTNVFLILSTRRTLRRDSENAPSRAPSSEVKMKAEAVLLWLLLSAGHRHGSLYLVQMTLQTDEAGPPPPTPQRWPRWRPWPRHFFLSESSD